MTMTNAKIAVIGVAVAAVVAAGVFISLPSAPATSAAVTATNNNNAKPPVAKQTILNMSEHDISAVNEVRQSEYGFTDGEIVDRCQDALRQMNSVPWNVISMCDAYMKDLHNTCSTSILKPEYCSDARIDRYLKIRRIL